MPLADNFFVRAPVSILRLCFRRLPFGIGASEGRDRDRYVRAARSAACNAVSAAMGFAVVLLSVSLTLPYLGQERFGIWMTISSLAVMLSVLDLGVANGLVNLVADAKTSDDQEKLQTIATRGVLLLVVIGAAAGAVLVGAVRLLDFQRLLRIESADVTREAMESTVVFITLFCVNIPLSGVRKVFHGLQRAWEPHIAAAIGYFFSLPLLYLCNRYRAPLPYLVLSTYGMQVGSTLILVWRLRRERIFRVHRGIWLGTGWQDSRLLLRTSSMFLILQLGMICGSACDPLIVSNILGAKEVATLAVAQRLFQAITVGMAMLSGPLWGLYADAHSRGEKMFIRHTLKVSMGVTGGIAVLTSALILAASPWLLKVWTGNHLAVPFSLLCAAGILAVVEAMGNAFTIFLNGMSELRPQLLAVLIFSAVSIPLKVGLLLTFGTVEWVVWSSIIASIIADYGVYIGLFRKQILAHASVGPLS
ncbi:O-antigen/teichoic acid export membrane protein [Paraburkholderia sp. Clong3]|uniref:lipopolysaccharide biosynthesis protein n=1 Tax=unclassified Paraburkholderia TaxID=2615204 RepID=UPI00160EE677|nr:MATE family efflux transporter [Paraburkholderia sp. CI2]MBB5468942.1 O-antigen/teichoic acid export membrane protein [Paraburkholderia sp. CI2]